MHEHARHAHTCMGLRACLTTHFRLHRSLDSPLLRAGLHTSSPLVSRKHYLSSSSISAPATADGGDWREGKSIGGLRLILSTTRHPAMNLIAPLFRGALAGGDTESASGQPTSPTLSSRNVGAIAWRDVAGSDMAGARNSGGASSASPSATVAQ
jgi:hypothetical protein